MRLVRNTTSDGRGKYMLFLTRRYSKEFAPGGTQDEETEVQKAVRVLLEAGLLDDPYPETEGEFFVIRLRDINAQPALRAYADHARQFDDEFASEVSALAARAGVDSPWCKKPD